MKGSKSLSLTAYEHAIFGPDRQKLFILDAEFHASLIAMTGNYYLVQQYLEIFPKAFLSLRKNELKVDRAHETVQEHKALFEAMRIRDVERAKELIKRHVVIHPQALGSVQGFSSDAAAWGLTLWGKATISFQ